MTRTARFLIGFTLISCTAMAQGIISTMVGTGTTCGYTPDGTTVSTSTQLCGAGVPAVDASGNIYFIDNNRIRVVSPAGILTTIAGNGQTGSTGDGGPALSATLNGACIRQTAVFGPVVCVADSYALKIRCVNVSTGIIQSYGTGASGTSGDGGSAVSATFSYPSGLAFDAAGNLYISDSSAGSVREVNGATGIINTVVGPGPGYGGGALGDGGPALGADIYEPGPLAYWNGGLYTADEGNRRVRLVNLSTGIISSVAGGGSQPPSTTGGPALQASIVPQWIMVDSSGNLFLTSQETIQEVTISGVLSIIAGQTGMDSVGVDYIPAIDTLSITSRDSAGTR